MRRRTRKSFRRKKRGTPIRKVYASRGGIRLWWMNYNYLSRTSCYSPMSIPRPNGRGSTDRITVPCNKCVACTSRLRQAWAFRLAQEAKTAETAFFITLTYAPEHLPVNEDGLPFVSKRDCQLFLKRLRRSLPNRKIRYYLVSEYGTERRRRLRNSWQSRLDTQGLQYSSIGRLSGAYVNVIKNAVSAVFSSCASLNAQARRERLIHAAHLPHGTVILSVEPRPFGRGIDIGL